MTRSQLEHIIRAAGAITNDNEIIVIGSQSILGQLPDAKSDLLTSQEADVYPKNKPKLADLIDGSIGEASFFEDTFGYYAHGVAKETAILPIGWESRLVKVQNKNTDNITGYCLDVHDLVLSKYAAGREKDIEFARLCIKYGYVNKEKIIELSGLLPIDESKKNIIFNKIERDFQFAQNKKTIAPENDAFTKDLNNRLNKSKGIKR
ncbi:MAG: DUF6036 family nucleotidyltransferase [bacterium]